MKRRDPLRLSSRLGKFLPLALGAVLLAMVLLSAGRVASAQAAGYVPDPPPGWHINPLSEPAWTLGGVRVHQGMVTATTRLADAQAADAWWDVYHLADDPRAANPASGALRDFVEGRVAAFDEGSIVFSVVHPGSDPFQEVRDFYLSDVGTRRLTKLPVGAGLYVPEIALCGGRVVWSQWGFHHQPEIMFYDLASGTSERVSEGPDAHRAPAIEGDDLVWQSWDGAHHRILYKDLATGETRTVAAGIAYTPNLLPQVANGRAIWTERDFLEGGQGRWSLYLADLDTGAKRLVLQTTGELQAELDGDLLVTSARVDDGPQDLVVRDLAAGTTRVLSDSVHQQAGFSADEGQVAWEDATPLPGGAGYHNRIMVFDSASGVAQTITEGDGLWQPRMDRGRVVFTETIDSEASRLWVAAPDGAAPYGLYLDVPALHPYREAIESFTERGFVSGYVTRTFRTFHPAYPLLRAQLAKILAASLDLQVDEDTSAPVPFADLGPDDPGDLYPHQYVNAVVAAGLMQGYGGLRFGPWDALTRSQMVTVVVRALQRCAPGTLEQPPPGYSGSVLAAPSAHAANLRLAEYNGLLAGIAGFGAAWDANAFARRGEVIQMLYEASRASEPHR